MEERYHFGGSFIVPTRFDFKVLSEYISHILSKDMKENIYTNINTTAQKWMILKEFVCTANYYCQYPQPKNKREFLTKSQHEKVIPNSTPKLHRYS